MILDLVYLNELKRIVVGIVTKKNTLRKTKIMKNA
jgi:hypothetical protein